MKRLILCLTFIVGLTGVFTRHDLTAQDVTITVTKTKVAPTKPEPPFTGKRPTVEVAILLDTSNSMDGLIDQAKNQLWNIIQKFAEAEKNGRTPTLRVALFEYGNSNLPSSENYIRQVVQLTDDMDKVSECLFSLTTNGGDEYCGAVIGEALTRLDWSNAPNAYKAIFIAGNEPFNQGSIDFRKSCAKAIQSGVVVNTIHCGDYSAGVQGLWKQGAEMTEGDYMNINQDRKVVKVKTPQDEIIIKLNAELNKTYLWFGDKSERQSYSMNQVQQDKNAMKSSSGFAGRGIAKAGKLYSNFNRDLVDTIQQNQGILDSLPNDQLPEKMQTMSKQEQKAYVEKLKSKRATIQKQIAEAAKARAEFIAEKRKQRAEAGQNDDTLGAVINSTVGKQLEASGFKIKK